MHIREVLGPFVGRRLVDITSDDQGDPDAFVCLMFDNGSTLTFPIEHGFVYNDPDEPDDDPPRDAR